MKVLSSKQIRQADDYTINHEPIASIDLMERASKQCVKELNCLFKNVPYSIYCGTGNNGGDGLAIARLLAEKGAVISVHLVHFSDKLSPDNEKNISRLKNLGVPIHHIYSEEDLKPPRTDSVVIDALVGSGLTRPLSGLLLATVKQINAANNIAVAIDIPSGMFCEEDNQEHLDTILKANYTLCFQVPKINFFLPSLFPYVGEWRVLNIGLDQQFIDSLETNYYYVDEELVQKTIMTRSPFGHKGTYGHSLIVSGSYGKMGAAILCAEACIHSGAGLVSAYIPRCGYEIMQSRVPEVMVHTSESDHYLSGEVVDLKNYVAIGVGPGIGKEQETSSFLQTLLNNATRPIVIDADALNILSTLDDFHKLIPAESILTPHLKEFERLFGPTKSCAERLLLQREVSIKYNFHIVLKGRFSSISSPNGSVYFNNTGNPGMATAGSGDVLTGVITALLSQGYSAHNSALLGAYLHGLAGDYACQKHGVEAMTASSIIEELGRAFKTAHGDQ